MWDQSVDFSRGTTTRQQTEVHKVLTSAQHRACADPSFGAEKHATVECLLNMTACLSEGDVAMIERASAGEFAPGYLRRQ